MAGVVASLADLQHPADVLPDHLEKEQNQSLVMGPYPGVLAADLQLCRSAEILKMR
jgi:hypothetical protein